MIKKALSIVFVVLVVSVHADDLGTGLTWGGGITLGAGVVVGIAGLAADSPGACIVGLVMGAVGYTVWMVGIFRGDTPNRAFAPYPVDPLDNPALDIPRFALSREDVYRNVEFGLPAVEGNRLGLSFALPSEVYAESAR